MIKINLKEIVENLVDTFLFAGKEGEWTYWERDGKRWLKFNYGDGLERVKLGEIEERDGMTYKIGKYEPYSGIVEETGGKRGYKLLGRFLDGKRDGK